MKEEEIGRLKTDLRKIQLESENNQKVYNRIFSSNAHRQLERV